ncbi:MAG: response regulator, partial [Flavobacteriaceae bacterium]|nr:response regulator [Flavobacteriaceae bacterium]
MIKVLVVDHHPIVRKGIIKMFESSPEIDVVGEADNGKELFNFIDNHRVDIVISEI